MVDPLMNEQHASALATIRELHALGATKVKVDGIFVQFDRVFVPLQQREPTLEVRVDGDAVEVTASEVEQLRAENEMLREFRRSAEALGVL